MEALPRLCQLSPRVFRVLGCNRSKFTLQGTNTYLVGTGRKRFLVDAGERSNNEYLLALAEALKQQKCEIERILITHWHDDHLGGSGSVIKTFATDPQGSLEISKAEFPGEDSFLLKNIPHRIMKHGDVFETDGATMVVHHTPGHSEDHASFYLEEERAVFSGDNVLGQGYAHYEDFSEYMKSLHHTSCLNPLMIYPGHGSVVKEGMQKIQDYITRLEKREKEILQTLEKNGNKPMTAEEILFLLHPEKAIEASDQMKTSVRALSIQYVLDYLQRKGSVEKKVEGKFVHWILT